MRLIDADILPRDIEPEDIDNAPTIEATPVVHAHWEDCTGSELDFFGSPVIVPRKRCSHCHRKNCKNYAPPYCPNCGAKMDGRADNG